MRLGGPIFDAYKDPAGWIAGLKTAGYSAAYAPVGPDADDATARAYVEAAAKAGIVIAEVGAWSNPISPSQTERRAAIDKCVKGLAHAERLGARCCVNIAGARGAQWDGPHPDNVSDHTFDLIVETTRSIIDSVKPRRTFYTLETMPWVFPDSADSYLRLIEAIDRPAFAVHFDPVNLINCPGRYFRTGEFIRDCFAKLGPRIRSCHAKDIALAGKLTVHLDEVRPGLGALDYGVYLTELAKLEPDTTLLIEHLPNAEEYAAAAKHIRQVAAEKGVSFR
jgi:sugar phosphate isomerase/epimerase